MPQAGIAICNVIWELFDRHTKAISVVKCTFNVLKITTKDFPPILDEPEVLTYFLTVSVKKICKEFRFEPSNYFQIIAIPKLISGKKSIKLT